MQVKRFTLLRITVTLAPLCLTRGSVCTGEERLDLEGQLRTSKKLRSESYTLGAARKQGDTPTGAVMLWRGASLHARGPGTER